MLGVDLEFGNQIVKELVREVDLGPFKHKVDDGLALRKFAFAALSALINTFPNLANAAMIDLVTAGLVDDEDVQTAA